MTKAELIESLAERQELSKAKMGRIVDDLLDSIVGSVGCGDEVSIPGFGKFTKVRRAARKGQNLQTGEKMDVPATNAVKFKPFSGFKMAVK